jgi:glycosyltransferase involved in cell wall biosynthesis
VLDEFFLRLSRRLADVIMTTGRKVAERHQKRLGEAQHVVPFYPPVDCSEFTPRQDLRDEVRREWGIDHDAPVLGTVSNINPQKGIDQLILALVHTRHREPAARLVIVGSEHDTHRKYATALRAEMMRWGLVEGTDVVFTGSRSDVHRQVQGFDVFVMGSVPNSEGVPTVVLEAMSAGLPVVATDVGGVSEVVENGVTGFVVPPLQPAVLADAALEILNDRELLRQMSAEARARAVQRFDIGVCIRTHLEAFDAALPGARGNLIERPRAA